jgi:hypothetical protein
MFRPARQPPRNRSSSPTSHSLPHPAVAYLSALCFTLLCVAGSYNEWVYGGLEFDPNSQVTVTSEGLMRPLAADAPRLGDTIQRWFTLGLTRAYFEGVSFARGRRGGGAGGWLCFP